MKVAHGDFPEGKAGVRVIGDAAEVGVKRLISGHLGKVDTERGNGVDGGAQFVDFFNFHGFVDCADRSVMCVGTLMLCFRADAIYIASSDAVDG